MLITQEKLKNIFDLETYNFMSVLKAFMSHSRNVYSNNSLKVPTIIFETYTNERWLKDHIYESKIKITVKMLNKIKYLV